MINQIAFPEQLLETADKFTVRDLLECPAFQPFLVSAISNGVRHFDLVNEPMDDRDELLMFKLDKLVRSIPSDVRAACYDKAGALIRESKERHNAVGAAIDRKTPSVVRRVHHIDGQALRS